MKYFQNLPGELNRSLSGSLNSPGELETLHDDQEVGVDVQHQVPGCLGCPGPVVLSPTAPDWAVAVSSPQLVPEVEPHHPGVGGVVLEHGGQGLQPHSGY